jgi:hypothetical protein
MASRAEHLAWARMRALEYLPEQPALAATSFISDLGKHPDTVGHAVVELLGLHMASGLLTAKDCRDLIEGST